VGYICELIVFNTYLTTTQRQQVEGYLAHKWGLSPTYASNTPLTIPGCALWLDAADPSTISFSSGSNISSWADKSGNGRNATGVNSPTLSGSNVVLNGTNQCLSCPNVSYRPSNIFVVATYTGGDGGGEIIRKGLGTGSTYEFGIAINSLTSLRYEIRTSGGGQININPTVSSVTGRQLYAMTYDNTTGIAYQNGNSLGSGTAAGPMFVGNTDLAIGAIPFGNSSYGAFFTGSFQEVIIYTTTPSTSQRQQVEGYLAHKWGLVGSLPATHPYVKTPP
jgi:hypothetical protein